MQGCRPAQGYLSSRRAVAAPSARVELHRRSYVRSAHGNRGAPQVSGNEAGLRFVGEPLKPCVRCQINWDMGEGSATEALAPFG
jgi:hypothetical protein